MGLWSHYVHVVSKAVLVLLLLSLFPVCYVNLTQCAPRKVGDDFLKKAFLEGWGGGIYGEDCSTREN